MNMHRNEAIEALRKDMAKQGVEEPLEQVYEIRQARAGLAAVPLDADAEGHLLFMEDAETWEWVEGDPALIAAERDASWWERYRRIAARAGRQTPVSIDASGAAAQDAGVSAYWHATHD
jgi:hypothetical protein